VSPPAAGATQFIFTPWKFFPARGVWGEVWQAWGRGLKGSGREQRITVKTRQKGVVLACFWDVTRRVWARSARPEYEKSSQTRSGAFPLLYSTFYFLRQKSTHGVLFWFLKEKCFERGFGTGTVPGARGFPPAFGAETGPKPPAQRVPRRGTVPRRCGAGAPAAGGAFGSSAHARLHMCLALLTGLRGKEELGRVAAMQAVGHGPLCRRAVHMHTWPSAHRAHTLSVSASHNTSRCSFRVCSKKDLRA